MKREGLLDFNEAVQHPGKKIVFQVQTSLPQEAEIDLIEPIKGTIEAISTGNLLLVNSHLRTKLVLECSRCTAPIETEFEFQMKDEFQVEGLPSAYSHEGFAKVVTDEPEPIFKDNSLILDAYIRQGLISHLPTQPLCSGSWDIPCAESLTTSEDSKEYGHPAFQSLSKLVMEEDS